MRTARPLLLTFASLLVIASCGSSENPSEPAADPTVVTDTAASPDTSASPDTAAGSDADAAADVVIKQSRFGPTEIEIGAGETVTFVNDDPFAHTVTSKDDAPLEFDSGEIGAGETFEMTFDEAGEYAYFCRIHPTMRATVTVN